jgi:hypothetical protein
VADEIPINTSSLSISELLVFTGSRLPQRPAAGRPLARIAQTFIGLSLIAYRLSLESTG